jgi:hypothetical protein
MLRLVLADPPFVPDDYVRCLMACHIDDLFNGCGRCTRPRLYWYEPIASRRHLGVKSTIGTGCDLGLGYAIRVFDSYRGDVRLIRAVSVNGFHRAITGDPNLAVYGRRC